MSSIIYFGSVPTGSQLVSKENLSRGINLCRQAPSALNIIGLKSFTHPAYELYTDHFPKALESARTATLVSFTNAQPYYLYNGKTSLCILEPLASCGPTVTRNRRTSLISRRLASTLLKLRPGGNRSSKSSCPEIYVIVSMQNDGCRHLLPWENCDLMRRNKSKQPIMRENPSVDCYQQFRLWTGLVLICQVDEAPAPSISKDNVSTVTCLVR
jgi:hypothetical protein